MTFDEFIQEQEKFGKINDRALPFLRQRYEQYCLHIEDQNYFEPIVTSDYQNDMGSIYDKNLYALFEFEKIESNQIYILRKPSFEPESLLTITNTGKEITLIYKILESNYWSMMYNGEPIDPLIKSTTKTVRDQKSGDRLFKLFDIIFSEARKPKGNYHVLDGVGYYLAKVIEGKRKIVFKNSPMENSKSMKVITIIDSIIEIARSEKQQLNNNLASQVEEILSPSL
jgi:hypothetical protein